MTTVDGAHDNSKNWPKHGHGLFVPSTATTIQDAMPLVALAEALQRLALLPAARRMEAEASVGRELMKTLFQTTDNKREFWPCAMLLSPSAPSAWRSPDLLRMPLLLAGFA